MQNYIKLRKLGEGSFGEVYLAVKKNDPTRKYAIKEIKGAKIKDKYLMNEIQLSLKFNHVNIAKTIEIQRNNKGDYFMVQEYINGGDLKTSLNKRLLTHKRPFNEVEAQHLIRQIFAGVSYLHNSNIIHRDLKPSNIMLHFNNEADISRDNILKATVKIIDFGLAKICKNDQFCFSTCGTPKYMDIPILQKHLQHSSDLLFYDKKVDIWSLGIICFQILTGVMPFAELERVLTENPKYKIPENLDISYEAVSFLNSMLQKDANKRLDINQLCKHQFLTGNVGSFRKLHLRKDLSLCINKNNSSHLNQVRGNYNNILSYYCVDQRGFGGDFSKVQRTSPNQITPNLLDNKNLSKVNNNSNINYNFNNSINNNTNSSSINNDNSSIISTYNNNNSTYNNSNYYTVISNYKYNNYSNTEGSGYQFGSVDLSSYSNSDYNRNKGKAVGVANNTYYNSIDSSYNQSVGYNSDITDNNPSCFSNSNSNYLSSVSEENTYISSINDAPNV